MLIYMMGASGAGKDSIMMASRNNLASNAQIFFAHRYITRPSIDSSENHISLSAAEFVKYAQAKFFCLQWHSHDLSYGIGIEVVHWLAAGKTVVVNGSREYLPVACKQFAQQIVPVVITVSKPALRQRLLSRARETPSQIEQRLARAAQYEQITHPRLHTIANNNKLSDAVDAFEALLKGCVAHSQTGTALPICKASAKLD